MTVANPVRRFWYSRVIPKSWFLNDSIDRDRDRSLDRSESYRDRSRLLDDLDDTRSFRRRYEDQPPPQAPKVQVPFSVIVTITIYLIGQLVAGIWWAATLQSNLQHEISGREKEEQRLWDSIQAYRAEVNALRLDIARATGNTSRRLNKEEE